MSNDRKITGMGFLKTSVADTIDAAAEAFDRNTDARDELTDNIASLGRSIVADKLEVSYLRGKVEALEAEVQRLWKVVTSHEQP